MRFKDRKPEKGRDKSFSNQSLTTVKPMSSLILLCGGVVALVDHSVSSEFPYFPYATIVGGSITVVL